MKTYSTAIVLSLTTGILLVQGGFGDMVELCEYVAGHPIWTHELADKALVNKLVNAVYEQHPQLKDVEKWNPNGEEVSTYLPGYVARQNEKFGATLDIKPGNLQRTEDPVESLERLASQAHRAGMN